MRKTAWIAWVAAGLLSGCAHFESRQLDPEVTGSRLEARTLSNPELRTFIEKQLGSPLKTWPLETWNLDQLTLAALFYAPDLDVARAEWNLAQAGIVTAGARPNPTLGVVPEFSANPESGFSPWAPAISVDFPIETAGKRRHRLNQAHHVAQASQWDVITAAWEIRNRVRTALTEWAAARERHRLLEKQIVLEEQIVARLEQRLAAGAIAASELLPARTQLAKTRLEVQGVQGEVAQALSRLAQALSVPRDALAPVQLAYPLVPVQIADVATARRRALQSRSDIRASLASYEAAQAALQLEIARQYPDVHLGPGYQWDQGESKWQLGIQVELPLLDRNRGPIAEAAARREACAARLLALQSRILGQIDATLVDLQSAETRTATAEALLAAHQNQLRTVEAQAAAGAADTIEVLTVQLELSTAETMLLEARTLNHSAAGALEMATQVLFGQENTTSSIQPAIESTSYPPNRSSLKESTR